jgi:hypothetical protein
LFTKDKVIPLPFLEQSSDGNIKLRPEVSDVDALPDFEEVHYISADEVGETEPEGTSRLVWYLPYGQGAAPAYPPFYDDLPPNLVGVKERNVPQGHVALKKNANVYGKNGEKIGTVDQIFTDPDSSQATHFIIEKGIFLTEDKLVPAWWVNVTKENEVHLAVSSSVFDRLPVFEPTR